MPSATDELRRMLDERGVEWGNIRRDGSESNFLTEWQFDGNDGNVVATERAIGGELSVEIHRYHLTPAQAIDATLGRGTCENTLHSSHKHFRCSACGEIYWYTDETVFYPFDFAFCPACGKKVVSE